VSVIGCDSSGNIVYPSCALKDRSGRDVIPVAVLLKAWVCSCSLDGIASSNPVEWHGCLSLVIIVRSISRADH